ncbi:MAG: D-alanine--D-alanine ligase family protein [Candidatus Aegiribacteria sp.]
MRVLLLFGGMSAEHEVSLVSAEFVGSVLRGSGHETLNVRIERDGSWLLKEEKLEIQAGHPVWKLAAGSRGVAFDVVFPVLHGPFGEDGTVQGLCMMAGWPFTGAGVMTSSLAMNKAASKRLAEAHGLPVLPWKSFRRGSPPDPDSIGELGWPVFVKPARMGSSVGISRVDGPEGLKEAVDLAHRFDSLIIVEKGLEEAREIEVALLSEGGEVSSSIPGEVVPGLEWYDYEAKYSCAESRLLIPAPIPGPLSDRFRRCAETSFSMMAGSGFARSDFLLGPRGEFYFNEINTIPGFTEISMFPKLWKASGVTPEELMERILKEATRIHAETFRNSMEVTAR